MTTRKEDAASIVGEELAEELEAKNNSLVGKSEALVIKAEDEDVTLVVDTPAPIIEEAKSGKPPKDDDDDEDMDTDSDDDDEADEKDGKKKKEYKKKSVATDEVLEVVKSLAVDVAQLKAAVIVETPTHPLHESLETFKSDYSAALKMSDLNPDEKLRLIQQSFDALGQRVIETIKAPQPAPEPSPINDMAKAFSEALQPLMLSMDMLSAKIQQLEAKAVVAPVGTRPVQPSVIPQRRSITPNLQMQSVVRSGVTPGAAKSETPNLRAIIERTT